MNKELKEIFEKFLYAVSGFILCAIIALLLFSKSIPAPLIAIIGIIIGSGLTFIFNRYLSKMSFKQQLLLSNLDKKLEAHQEAFAIWWDIRSNVHEKDEIFGVVIKAQEWWKNNCLYLLPKSRAAFYNCLVFATNHRDYIDSHKRDRNNIKEIDDKIQDSWDIIVAPGKVIPQELELLAFEDQDKFFKS